MVETLETLLPAEEDHQPPVESVVGGGGGGVQGSNGGREGTKTGERKWSKDLSYPYTSLSKETHCFLSWADPANEIPKADRCDEKKQTPGNELVSPAKDTHGIGHRTSSSNGESKPKRKRKDEAMLQSPHTESDHAAGTVEPKRKRKDEAARLQNPQIKVEHAAGTVNMKQNYNNEKDNGVNSGAAALLLTFAAGVSLPSKDDLVTVFGKFGALNELETNVLQDSCSAQVVYVKTSDAETAFNSSGKISQFGPEMVTYRLWYLSTTSKASKHGASSNQVLPTTSPSSVVGDQTPANQPASGQPLLLIKQNLEKMTSLLERSGNNLLPGTRAKLEGEIKDLLKKVDGVDLDKSVDSLQF